MQLRKTAFIACLLAFMPVSKAALQLVLMVTRTIGKPDCSTIPGPTAQASLAAGNSTVDGFGQNTSNASIRWAANMTGQPQEELVECTSKRFFYNDTYNYMLVVLALGVAAWAMLALIVGFTLQVKYRHQRQKLNKGFVTNEGGTVLPLEVLRASFFSHFWPARVGGKEAAAAPLLPELSFIAHLFADAERAKAVVDQLANSGLGTNKGYADHNESPASRKV
eukprot:SAG22_NODE_1217_length_5138_cov_6.636039_2_plen_222_part_00